jgi:hypothetical protein
MLAQKNIVFSATCFALLRMLCNLGIAKRRRAQIAAGQWVIVILLSLIGVDKHKHNYKNVTSKSTVLVDLAESLISLTTLKVIHCAKGARLYSFHLA